MKYTEDNVKAFVEAIKIGVKIKNACELIGINQDTYFTWVKEHPEFSDLIKRARGERTREALMVIRKAALKSWQAAAWYLERTFPDQYGLKAQLTLPPQDEESAKKTRTERLTRRLNEIIEEQVKAGSNGHSGSVNEKPNAPAAPSGNVNGNGSAPSLGDVAEFEL